MDLDKQEKKMLKINVKDLAELYEQLENNANKKVCDIVNKIVNLEIEIERFCNI